MGFFSRNYNKPGPGVQKDEPRKKGVARFFELLVRDFSDFIKLNLLFCIVLIPSIAALVFGSLFFGLGIGFIAGVLLAFPVGGALTAYYYYITKMMRDDPSYVWFEFKRKFLENYKQTALIGMLCTGFVFAQILLWGNLINLMILGETVEEFIWYFFVFLSFFIFMMLLPFIFLHHAYVHLGTLQVLKNSVMMAFGYLPRSFMGALLGGISWILFAFFFPVSMVFLPIIILFGVSLSMLLSLMWVWPVFDKFFKVEEILTKRREEGGDETLNNLPDDDAK